MNTITFYRMSPKGSVEERRVKVIQPSYTVLIGAARGQRKCQTPRGMTVAEAEDKMLREGFTRKKPKSAARLKKAA